jgi:hypothetical protein
MYGMPIFSATEPAATCSAVAATMTSQPCAASPITQNCVATVVAIRSRTCSGEGRGDGPAGRAAIAWRTSGPSGVTATPKPSIHSRKSGGTHSRTSCPSVFDCSARATSGWTSPRDPIVDSNARIVGSARPIVTGSTSSTAWQLLVELHFKVRPTDFGGAGSRPRTAHSGARRKAKVAFGITGWRRDPDRRCRKR